MKNLVKFQLSSIIDLIHLQIKYLIPWIFEKNTKENSEINIINQWFIEISLINSVSNFLRV
jgi:hypothetical protein